MGLWDDIGFPDMPDGAERGSQGKRKYRVIPGVIHHHHIVQNLPLTSKQKFGFGLARTGQSRTFVMKSAGGFAQCGVSPCKLDKLAKKEYEGGQKGH